ncbi:MAG: hypothetical protein ACLFNU_02470 [Bacteroidales bacterium]
MINHFAFPSLSNVRSYSCGLGNVKGYQYQGRWNVHQKTGGQLASY